jgi:hypothetical protein
MLAATATATAAATYWHRFLSIPLPIHPVFDCSRFLSTTLHIDAVFNLRRLLLSPHPIANASYRSCFLPTPFSIDAVKFLSTLFVFYRRR